MEIEISSLRLSNLFLLSLIKSSRSWLILSLQKLTISSKETSRKSQIFLTSEELNFSSPLQYLDSSGN